MEIPYKRIPHETLINMIREFVMREGTDYTHRDIPIDIKIQQVFQQIKTGKVVITFDVESNSFSLQKKSRV